MESIPENKEAYIESYRQRLVALMQKTSLEDMMTVHTELGAKAGAWATEYGLEAENYAMYNLLIGSTLPEGRVAEHLDFPGEDTVAKFIEELEKKYLKL